MTLSEEVVILEELVETDSVPLDLGLELEDEGFVSFLTDKGPHLADILRLLGLVNFINLLLIGLEWVAIVDELHVLDLIVVSTVDLVDGKEVLIGHCEAEIGKSLSELLRGDLEVLVAVPILEETLGVKSVPLEPVSESSDDIIDQGYLV